jgi:hypothetical protein
MRRIGILLSLVCTVAYAPIAAADLESAPLRPPTYSLSELPRPEGSLYISPWADRYGQMPDLGVNDESTPIYPFDSGANPLDPDGY